jgi:hypothetical protein
MSRTSASDGGGSFAGGQVVRHLAEDPRPALRGAADHHRIHAGLRSTSAAFCGESMSPLAITGMRSAA